MGDPLTNRKSSDAVLLRVPGTGRYCWLAGPQAGLTPPHLMGKQENACPQGCREAVGGALAAWGPPGGQGAHGLPEGQ